MNARPTGPEPVFSESSDNEVSGPGAANIPMRQTAWQARPLAEDKPLLTIGGELMRNLAIRALAAGGGGLTKIGVAAIQHGEGATTIARSLAACLSEHFHQRVLLVEANQRSPCLREICGLSPGAGLSDVLSGAASLEATLRVSRSAGKMLVLPASVMPAANVATLPAPAIRDLVAELFFYADALVFDLAPLLPYPDSGIIGRALDGMAVVMRAGKSGRAECAHAVQALQAAAVPVLGAVLNREKSFVPRFLERRL